jgi:hypothetical protein
MKYSDFIRQICRKNRKKSYKIRINTFFELVGNSERLTRSSENINYLMRKFKKDAR